MDDATDGNLFCVIQCGLHLHTLFFFFVKSSAKSTALATDPETETETGKEN